MLIEGETLCETLTENLTAELEAQRGADAGPHVRERQGCFTLTYFLALYFASLVFSQPCVTFHLFVSSPTPTTCVPLISLSALKPHFEFPSFISQIPSYYKCSPSSPYLLFTLI